MTTVVVQVAMEEEARPFLALASEASEPVVLGRAEHRGIVVDGRTVVLVRSGVGMVNATDAALGAIHRYGDDVLLVSAGSAGGLGRDVRVGEVFVGTAYVNVEADARAFGYAAGQVPGMPETYPTDPVVSRALADGGPAGIPVRHSVIGSGEKFVTVDIGHRLREVFPTLAVVDMESAAVAQLAFNHGVRFASIRGISDLCAPDGEEFLTHVDDAADRSAAVVRHLLAAL